MKKSLLCFLCLCSMAATAQQWYYSNIPYHRTINAVHIQNPTNVFVAGGHFSNDSIQSVMSTDGLNWNFLFDVPFVRSLLNDMYFTDSLTIYACGYNGGMLKSNDAGQHWHYQTTPIPGRNYRKLTFTSPLKGFAVGSNYPDSLETIITTSDSGATWTTVIDQPGHGLNALTFINADTGFAVGNKGTILTTTNAGATWLPVVAPLTAVSYTGIYFTTPTVGYIIGGDDSTRVILNTNDGGATWNIVRNERGAILRDITFNQTKGYIVGANSSFLSSTNGGQTWTLDTILTFGPYSDLTSVRYYNDSFGVVASSTGFMFYYTHSALPTVYTLGASLIDSSDVSLSLSIHTHHQAGQFYFLYTTDSTWQTYNYGYSNSIICDSTLIFNNIITGLTPRTTYYYCSVATTLQGTVYGDTLKFYTGTPYTTLTTQPATAVTTTAATLNGVVDKFIIPAALDFEYGTTPALGSHTTATPASISDTLAHTITASLSALQAGVLYYYRLRAFTSLGYQYGGIRTFFTGQAYNTLNTLSATFVTDSSATLNGFLDGLLTPVTLSFEYGTTPSLGTTVYNTTPSFVSDTFPHSVNSLLTRVGSNLQPNTLYFYRIVAQSSSIGTFYGNTMTFYTSTNVSNALNTLSATNITASSATLQGVINHFPTLVLDSFEYGTTQSFGTTVPGMPAIVNDTFSHLISASLTGLLANTVYYYRLKGTYAGGNTYGATKYLYTGGSDIPNWDFQYWTDDTVDLPVGYRMLGDNFVKVAGRNGGSAVKLFGLTAMLHGALTDSKNNQGPAFFGGIPLHARPDSVIAYVNYYVEPGDTALFLVDMNKDTTIVSYQFNLISGNSGGQFQRLAFPISYQSSLTPDSVVMGFITSNAMSQNRNSVHGITNYLIIDDVSFTPAPPVPIPNGDFEQWITYSYRRLDTWNYMPLVGFDWATQVNNTMVKQTYFSPPFDYAAEVSNIRIEGKTLGGSLATGGTLFYDQGPNFPVFINHQTLNGYYQFYPDGNDTLSIQINMYKNGLQIGSGYWYEADSVTQFTPFQIPIQYFGGTSQNADSGSIKIEPHKNNIAGLSRAIIDKLSFDGFVLGIDEAMAKKQDGIKVYPNPTSDIITVEMEQPTIAETQLLLTDMTGKLIKDLIIPQNQSKIHIDLSDMASGYFILTIRNNNVNFNRNIALIRQ